MLFYVDDTVLLAEPVNELQAVLMLCFILKNFL